MVLPLPVGVATSALSSVLYSAVNTCRQGVTVQGVQRQCRGQVTMAAWLIDS
jgi:hypothetical protein